MWTAGTARAAPQPQGQGSALGRLTPGPPGGVGLRLSGQPGEAAPASAAHQGASWTPGKASLLGTSAQPVAWGPPRAWPQGLSSQEETSEPKTPLGLVLCRWVSRPPPEAPWWSPGHPEAGITAD